MSDRLDLAAIKAYCDAAQEDPPGIWEYERLIVFAYRARTDLPALVAWAEEARTIVQIFADMGSGGAMFDDTVALLSRLAPQEGTP